MLTPEELESVRQIVSDAFDESTQWPGEHKRCEEALAVIDREIACQVSC